MARQLRLGTLIDRLKKADDEVKKHNAELEKAKKKRTKIENEIMDRFSNQQIDGASGKLARVKLRDVTQPSLKDWKKLAAFVYRYKALDLFQRRLAKTAWEDRVKARKGRPVPGITAYKAKKISLVKK